MQSTATSIITCKTFSTGSLSSSTFSTGSPLVWHCVLLIVHTYLLELFILTSACSGRHSLHSASRADIVLPHGRTAIKQHRAFSTVDRYAWKSLPSGLHCLPQTVSSSFFKLLKSFHFTGDGLRVTLRGSGINLVRNLGGRGSGSKNFDFLEKVW